MAQSLTEWLKAAPLRDEQYREAVAAAEAREDQRFDALSDLIDEHPVGRPMAKVS